MDEADDFVTLSSCRADIDPNGVMDVVAQNKRTCGTSMKSNKHEHAG
jgi:hypothetical protein